MKETNIYTQLYWSVDYFVTLSLPRASNDIASGHYCLNSDPVYMFYLEGTTPNMQTHIYDKFDFSNVLIDMVAKTISGVVINNEAQGTIELDSNITSFGHVDHWLNSSVSESRAIEYVHIEIQLYANSIKLSVCANTTGTIISSSGSWKYLARPRINPTWTYFG